MPRGIDVQSQILLLICPAFVTVHAEIRLTSAQIPTAIGAGVCSLNGSVRTMQLRQKELYSQSWSRGPAALQAWLIEAHRHAFH